MNLVELLYSDLSFLSCYKNFVRNLNFFFLVYWIFSCVFIHVITISLCLFILIPPFIQLLLGLQWVLLNVAFTWFSISTTEFCFTWSSVKLFCSFFLGFIINVLILFYNYFIASSMFQAWVATRRVSKDDWMEWVRRLSVELLKESPSPALRSCWALSNAYNPLARYFFAN